MKTYLSILFASVLLLAGCTTLNPETGEKVFDPVKTELALSGTIPVIAEIVSQTSAKDPNTRSAFVIVETIISNLLAEGGDVTRDEIMRRVQEIPIQGMDDESRAKLLTAVGNMVLHYYDLGVAYIFRQELPKAQALPIVLKTIKEGVNLGLQM